jgi:predicted RNA-binding Zn ribbon-like protein
MTGVAGAAEAIESIRSFLNTVDLESGADQIATPQGLTAWLAGRGLLAGGEVVTDQEVARVIAAREALRDVIAAHGRDRVAEPVVEVMNQIARSAPLVVTFDAAGHASLAPGAGGGVETALGRILADVVAAVADGTWARLKVCRNQACRWAFYDRSRNRSGVWCQMAVCGNRMKGRAFRRRRRSAGSADR